MDISPSKISRKKLLKLLIFTVVFITVLVIISLFFYQTSSRYRTNIENSYQGVLEKIKQYVIDYISEYISDFDIGDLEDLLPPAKKWKP